LTPLSWGASRFTCAPLAFCGDLLYKVPVLQALSTISRNALLIEEDLMKKLLCAVSVVMLSLIAVGCGNSPDGDKQKLEAPASPSL
jgi:hypothetical protein